MFNETMVIDDEEDFYIVSQWFFDHRKQLKKFVITSFVCNTENVF